MSKAAELRAASARLRESARKVTDPKVLAEIDVAAFADSMSAIDALEHAHLIEGSRC